MKVLVTRLVVFCLAFTLLGCSSPKLNKLESGDVILAFGDSLTEGVGAPREHSYPSNLAKLSGFKVVNAGVSGETTAEGLLRFQTVIEKTNPSLIIMLEGGNDILRNKSQAQTKRNLAQMIQLALDRGIQVVLIGVPEKSLFSDSAPFYAELAQEYDLVFDDSLISSLMRSPAMKSDPVHFNSEGYLAMAESIYDLLSSHGALN